MFFIVGLGNPGEKFKNTRHNVGFEAIDYFALENNFPDFRLDKKSNSLISDKNINDQKVLLIKPQTFMNLSGKSVKYLLNYYNSDNKSFLSFLFKKFKKRDKDNVIDNLVVIQDDLDIEIGKIKVVQGRGAGGHNGIKSIIQELGTKNFIRIRIGIKPINNKETLEKTTISNFVLGRFKNQEKKLIKEINKEIDKKLKTLLI